MWETVTILLIILIIDKNVHVTKDFTVMIHVSISGSRNSVVYWKTTLVMLSVTTSGTRENVGILLIA